MARVSSCAASLQAASEISLFKTTAKFLNTFIRSHKIKRVRDEERERANTSVCVCVYIN